MARDLRNIYVILNLIQDLGSIPWIPGQARNDKNIYLILTP